MQDSELIFGGSFDPVHNGHLITARAVAEAACASRVVLMPTAANPLKNPPLATDEQRLDMLRLAIAGDELFSVSELEIRHQPPTYTIETIEYLRKIGHNGRLILAMGADNIASLPHWCRSAEVLDSAEVIIACRPPQTVAQARQAVDALAGQFEQHHLTQLREAVIETPLIDISSTDIRQRVAAGVSVRYLVPNAVAEYIQRKRIYAS